MKPSPRHRITAAAVALGAGLLALAHTPRVPTLERADRALLGFLLARTGTDPQSLAGTGAHDDPRRARGAPTRVPAGDLPPPRILSLTDDPEKFFESSPPGPLDLTFILNQLHKLGHRRITIASLLAWEHPDPVAGGALNHELGRFEPAIVATPLVRGLSTEAMPPAFARLSVPLDRISGDPGALPIVNRVALPGLHLGGPSTLAAFTRLESEAAPPFGDGGSPVPVPMLARWGDRVVVSLPLAHLMVRFGVSAGQLTITPGREIRVGEDGPIVPIDIHGQTPVMPGTAGNEIAVAATELVRTRHDDPPESLTPADMPLVIRDDRPDAPPATREYSAHLADTLVALDRAPRAGRPNLIRRPHTAVEILLLAALAGLAGWVTGFRPAIRHPAFAGLLAGSAALALALLAGIHATPPPLALAAAPLAGWLGSLWQPCSHTAGPAPTPAPSPETPKPIPDPSRRPAGKKPRGKRRKSRRKRP